MGKRHSGPASQGRRGPWPLAASRCYRTRAQDPDLLCWCPENPRSMKGGRALRAEEGSGRLGWLKSQGAGEQETEGLFRDFREARLCLSWGSKSKVHAPFSSPTSQNTNHEIKLLWISKRWLWSSKPQVQGSSYGGPGVCISHSAMKPALPGSWLPRPLDQTTCKHHL